MPIRLNLLAEEQAAEELRRRDPVKRAVLIGVLVVAAVVLWAVLLQFEIIRRGQQLGQLRVSINALTNQYHQVQAEVTKLEDIRFKLSALNKLATSRFLWATALNALQQTTVDDVQLTQFKGEQSYVTTEATKATTNEAGRFVPAKPATATEKIVLSLKAIDSGPGRGDNVLKYIGTLNQFPYFQAVLGKTNQIQLGPPPKVGQEAEPKAVEFTLEGRLQEKTR